MNEWMIECVTGLLMIPRGSTPRCCLLFVFHQQPRQAEQERVVCDCSLYRAHGLQQ
jgi:hypothetical protein